MRTFSFRKFFIIKTTRLFNSKTGIQRPTGSTRKKITFKFDLFNFVGIVGFAR